MIMNENEFKKEHKKLLKLIKKEKITNFIGYGMFPQGKGDIFKVWDQLAKCLDYEPYLEYIRKEGFGLGDDD